MKKKKKKEASAFKYSRIEWWKFFSPNEIPRFFHLSLPLSQDGAEKRSVSWSPLPLPALNINGTGRHTSCYGKGSS